MTKNKNNLVDVEILDIKLTFETLPDLFSPKNIDPGTKLLLNEIFKSDIDYTNVLDWGCGWGVLGIVLAAKNPKAKVTAIDSDIAAIKISQSNKELSKLTNIDIIASYGFDSIPKDKKFDLIASHPPTHRGRQVVEDMIKDSFLHLNKDGSLFLVVEARLKPWVARAMKQVFTDYKLVSRTSKHVILRAIK